MVATIITIVVEYVRDLKQNLGSTIAKALSLTSKLGFRPKTNRLETSVSK